MRQPYRKAERKRSKTVGIVSQDRAVLFSKCFFAGFLVLATAGCVPSLPFSHNAAPSDTVDLPQAERLVQAARTLHSMGDDARAARLAIRAAEVASERADIWLYAATLAEQAGDTEEARKARREAARRGSRDPEALLEFARYALLEERFEEAMRGFDEASKRLPMQDHRGRLGAGVALDRLGRHADAQRLYRTVLATDANNGAAQSNLGLSLILSGKAVQGLALLRQLAAREPRYASNLAEAEALVKTMNQRPHG